MPTYVYEVIRGDDDPREPERFEVVQSMKDDALKVHPETGEPVRRVILAPNVPVPESQQSGAHAVDNDRRLNELGFTKYVKSSDGTYEKRAGQGPGRLDPNQ
ncbi:MAG: hypothetical protein Tsb0013_19560 [Phycisphaerales bacterium]